MDFATKEIFKRYASIVVGRPISPVFLNILVTSVCDMRCTHCFFTEELDDRPRKKLQMKSERDRPNFGNIGRESGRARARRRRTVYA
jgi:hypothetical protein